MIKDILVTFLAVSSTFMLFFFSTPYWTGAAAKKEISNGIYEWAYYKAAGAGFQLYQLIESLSNEIAERMKRPRCGAFRALLNTLLYVAVVYVATTGYESAINFLIGEGNADLLDDTSANLNNAAILWRVMNHVGEVTSGSGFLSALGEALAVILLCVACTKLFFIFMYGLLEFKMHELHLAQRWWGVDPERLSDEAKTIREIPQSIFAKLVSFIDHVAYFENFKIAGVMGAFALVSIGYSAVLVYTGNGWDMQSCFLDLLGEIGVFEVLDGFLVDLMTTWMMGCLGVLVYQVLPMLVRNAIDRASAAGHERVKVIRERREKIAKKYRGVRVEEMHLE